MKKISICIGCFNEEVNIMAIYERLNAVINNCNGAYEFEILFEDNDSKDKSQEILRELCQKDKRVKVIINEKNYGPVRSIHNCLFSASGDAVISIACDMQDPPEMIPDFIKEWENGYKVVWGQKNKSEESKVMFFTRTLYYKIINLFSENQEYEHVTGFGLYDKSVLREMKNTEERYMSFRNLVTELGYDVKLISYAQNKREAGKSSYNVKKYFDFALNNLVRTSKAPLRMATLLGFFSSIISLIIGFVYLIYKLVYWDRFSAGMGPIMIAIFFIGSVQLFFMGIIGEYIGVLLDKSTKRPLVVIKEKINFEEE